MTPLISIEKLRVQFGDPKRHVPAVADLNMEIHPGEFIALVGESGSGKSVTAMSLLQLLPRVPGLQIQGNAIYHPANGTLTDLLTLSPQSIDEIRGSQIGMVFQEPMTALNPLMTCGDQIAEVLRAHMNRTAKQARIETLQWLERVKLPNPGSIYERYPHELSGGQKQRVLIASAICCGPALLICDEPTTALDVTVQKEILDLIRSEQTRTGMAVLFISHDLALVSQYADRVAVLYKGELMETGTSPEIFRRPKHAYTRALLACRPAAHQKGNRLPMISDFLSTETVLNHPRNKHIEPKASGETFLSIENLHVGYPKPKEWLRTQTGFVNVVHAVNFDIQKGEMLGLVGESGSGKSTLGRALLGLIKPQAGSIRHQGTDLATLPVNRWPLRRQQLQLIFQDPYSSLNPRMPIGEAIGEPLRIHGVVDNKSQERKLVQEWLERVQLDPDHYSRYPHEFSGGQRQRIVIARALALRPDFVVCDESVSALDVSIQAQVLNLLNDLRAELGFTTLFISHDLGVIQYLCDRLIVLQNGTIVEMGKTESVCKAPQHHYTQNLLQSIPQLQSPE